MFKILKNHCGKTTTLLRSEVPFKRSEVFAAGESILFKCKLYHQHIRHRSRADGYKGVTLPYMKKNDHGGGYKSGDERLPAGKVDIRKAVDNEHTYNCGRHNSAEIGNDGGGMSASEKYKGRGTEDKAQNGYDRNKQKGMFCGNVTRHFCPPFCQGRVLIK